MSPEWTDKAVIEELKRRESEWKRGVCPDSGLEVHDCHKGPCDCFGAEGCPQL